jgi:hypothetical protein
MMGAMWGRLVLLIAALTLGLADPGAAGASNGSVPTATPVRSIKTVGPLFFPSLLGLVPALHGPHFCSASVVHSAGHDLVITAAHCVYGTGPTIEFAPGFHDGIAPYGVWQVTRLYVDRAWRTSRDPHRDVAFLRVAPRNGRHIEDVVGAHALGVPVAGSSVTVDGYPAGSGGRPITCTNRLYLTHGYPSFACRGYVAGVSGGPWLAGGRVVGVIGGFEQGGCTDAISYSSPFGAWTAALLRRAQAGGPGDIVPIGFFANAC